MTANARAVGFGRGRGHQLGAVHRARRSWLGHIPVCQVCHIPVWQVCHILVCQVCHIPGAGLCAVPCQRGGSCDASISHACCFPLPGTHG